MSPEVTSLHGQTVDDFALLQGEYRPITSEINVARLEISDSGPRKALKIHLQASANGIDSGPKTITYQRFMQIAQHRRGPGRETGVAPDIRTVSYVTQLGFSRQIRTNRVSVAGLRQSGLT